MAAPASPNAFEYIDKADQIAGDVFVGIGNRVPHARLRSQMNHGFKLTFAKEAFHTFSICQIERDKPELGAHAEFSQPRILKSRVVVVVQVVYANHFKPVRQQPVDEMGANKTSRTGDHDPSVFRSLRHFVLASVGCGESVRALAG